MCSICFPFDSFFFNKVQSTHTQSEVALGLQAEYNAYKE